MFRFLKEHSYEIVRLFFTQIGLAVFGLILAMATASNLKICCLSSVFSTLFYCCLLYSQGWEHGAKDKPRVDNGRLPYMPWRGLVYGGFANLPNALLVLILFVCLCFPAIEFFGNTYAVVWQIERFLSAMLLGINNYFSPRQLIDGNSYIISDSLFHPLFYLFSMIPPIFSVGFGYFMGVRDKTIFPVKRR